MPKRAWGVVVLALCSGVPLYLLLDGLDLLSPSLREQPWPLAALAGGFALLALGLTRSGAHGALARICAVAALASPAAVLLVATATAARLPPQARELAVGVPLPDAALVTPGGETLRLASLRGEPLVLVVYRGAS